MSAVATVARILGDARVAWWLYSGWAVDALTRRRRAHGDVDVFVERRDLRRALRAISDAGHPVRRVTRDKSIARLAGTNVEIAAFDRGPHGRAWCRSAPRGRTRFVRGAFPPKAAGMLPGIGQVRTASAWEIASAKVARLREGNVPTVRRGKDLADLRELMPLLTARRRSRIRLALGLGSPER
jgi:hypothetical protein